MGGDSCTLGLKVSLLWIAGVEVDETGLHVVRGEHGDVFDIEMLEVVFLHQVIETVTCDTFSDYAGPVNANLVKRSQ